jgi:hypothetical protein
MGDQAKPLAQAAPADNVVPLPGALEAVIRALAGAITTGGTLLAPSADPGARRANRQECPGQPGSLITPGQVPT